MSNKPASFKKLEVQYGFRTKKSLSERTDKKAMAIKARQRSYNNRMSSALLAAKKFITESVSIFSKNKSRMTKVDM